jgi:hypothetical protein
MGTYVAARTVEIKRIDFLTRLNCSVNGNPRYRVAFTDGSVAITSSDASCAYGIANPEMRGDLRVTFTRAGRIEMLEPVTI